MPNVAKVGAITKMSGSRYPAPFDEPCRGREWRKLGDAVGVTQFGVHQMLLRPGVWSSQRHWHSHEDEFVYVLRGEVTLVTNAGPLLLRGGECAGFKAGVADGHCFQNRSNQDVELLIVGSRNDADQGEFSDVDMRSEPGRYSAGKLAMKHKDGRPY